MPKRAAKIERGISSSKSGKLIETAETWARLLVEMALQLVPVVGPAMPKTTEG
jgi:hypothetical protein